MPEMDDEVIVRPVTFHHRGDEVPAVGLGDLGYEIRVVVERLRWISGDLLGSRADVLEPGGGLEAKYEDGVRRVLDETAEAGLALAQGGLHASALNGGLNVIGDGVEQAALLREEGPLVRQGALLKVTDPQHAVRPIRNVKRRGLLPGSRLVIFRLIDGIPDGQVHAGDLRILPASRQRVDNRLEDLL